MDSERKKLAMDAVRMTQSRLMTALPYLNLALLRMPVQITDETGLIPGIERKAPFGTDGETVFWSGEDILRRFVRSENSMNRSYLHMVMHCIFLHPFGYHHMNADWWDAAADIAAEHMIRSLGVRELEGERDLMQQAIERDLLFMLEEITADRIYHKMQEDEVLAAEILRQSRYFKEDTHTLWVPPNQRRWVERSLFARTEKLKNQEKQWKKISSSVKMLRENESDRMGEERGQRSIHIGQVQPQYRDYAALLRKYAVLREEMLLDPDEFDTIYYTYGLSLYGNVPLVEPLEYREIRRVRELVIAIDTSGSTQGNKIRNFLSQTYAILSSTDAFFEHFRVHILQCDCEIQSDDVVCSREEFLQEMQDFTVKGGGGTSFIPVFRYVQEQIEQGEYTELQGLLYFTDGNGQFPQEDPGIRTAFILYADDCPEEKIPAWADTVRLGGE